jgi:hypothetical protein
MCSRGTSRRRQLLLRRYELASLASKFPGVGKSTVVRHARRVVITLLALGLLGLTGVTAQAFTLISGKPYVSSSPTSGLPTATFTVRGKYVWQGQCPAPIPITFKFYWYKVISNKVLLWTKTASTCNASVVDTGSSPALLPPPSLNYASSFTIQVAVYGSNGARFGQYYTNTTIYRVLAPPPAPSPKASPKPSASPSPTTTPCATALLAPASTGGSDVLALLAVGGLGTLPIAVVAMVLSPGPFRRRSGWSRLAALIGLSVVLLTAEACAPPNQTAQVTPGQSETSPSPSPSPSC